MGMRFVTIIIVGIVLATGLEAQDSTKVNDINLLERVIVDGDTFLIADIDEIYILPKRKFSSRREMRRYYKLIRNVKKVYPYSQVAREFFDSVNVELVNYDNERDKKSYLKSVEKDLLAEYEDELKGLNITQGRILLKLIDRELNSSPYNLLKEYRGDFSAVFWQTIARIFGNNLKNRFDPEGEDKMLNEVVLLIERGVI